MFRELGERAVDPAVVWHEYSAPADCELDDRAAWSAGESRARERDQSRRAYMADMARRALASPADSTEFVRSARFERAGGPGPGNDRLARGLESACLVGRSSASATGRCVVGFDLGGSASMTALVALWPRSGRMEAWGAFPAVPDALARGAADGVGGLYSTNGRTRRGRDLSRPGDSGSGVPCGTVRIGSRASG